jgi:acetoin utilization protein AcuB
MTADLRVRDLMGRDVKTLRRNDKLTIADELMRMERIRHLPVLDEEEELAGIVSQRDLFRSALARTLGYGETAQNKLLDMLKVKEVMTRPVETIGPDAPISEAARLMSEKKIGCLVVTEGERIAGILTEGDFVRHLAG